MGRIMNQITGSYSPFSDMLLVADIHGHCELAVSAEALLLMHHEPRNRRRVDQAWHKDKCCHKKRIHRGDQRSP